MTKYLALNKVIPVMLIYSLITCIGMYHHELWFDEVQHWLIARDSSSIFELASNNRYDVHVLLGKILLFLITHFISDNPLVMQVFHLIIINVAAYIFLRYAPFNLLSKILILFGYYFIFEYSILCRNYALGILFLFIVCTLLSKPDKNLFVIGILLILMCNTHIFFIFSSIGIYFYLLCYNYEHKNLNNRFFSFTLIFFIGFIIAVIPLVHIPAGNNFFHPDLTSWMTVHNFLFAVHGIDKGFIPFPPLHDPNFWNRHLFEGWSSYIKVPISLLFIVYPVWVIKNSPKALLFYISCSLCLILFLTISQMTGSRYYGMFYIYFMAAIWLADFDGINVLYINKDKKKSMISIVAISLFYLILFTQVLAGAFIYEQDYTRPFSQGKNTVAYIQSQHLDKLPVVIDGYNAGPVLSAYFRHPVYYLDIDTIGSYGSAKTALNPKTRKPLIQEIRESKYLQSLNEFILISSRLDCDSEVRNIPIYQFYKLKSFENAIIIAENYCLFKVVRKQLNIAPE